MRRCDRVARWLGIFVLGLSAIASRASAQALVPVNIESTPAGAQVFVDAPGGAALCTTPCRAVRVPGGAHTLHFRLERHADAQAQVTIRTRRETFRATLSPLSTIAISGGSEATIGAAVRVDGVPVGNVPYSASLSPGRHLVQVGREGFVTFSQWVDLAPAQGLQLPVVLEREAPQTGSLLVASDVSGAEVRIDGDAQVRGTTPTFIENLSPGAHAVELRAPGLPARTETVTIQTGQRATLNVTLRPAAPQGGTLRVLANAAGARVSVDGEALGEAPATRANLAPGEHIVEAVADGYERLMQTVTIEAGAQRVVSLELRAQSLPPGRIVVSANVGTAHVTIDGEDRGQAPVVVENAPGGAHAVVVVAQGYEDFRTTCEIRAGQNCTIDARLEPIGTPVLVTANVEGAELVVDGRPRGPTPYEGNLPVGQHQIEVRAEGHAPYVAQIDLVASAERRAITATLRNVADEEQAQTRAERAQRRLLERRTAMITAAGPLPPELFVIGLSLGWPHLAEMRLGVGLTDYLEAGFTVRSMFGRATEFEGRVELSRRFTPQISVAASVRRTRAPARMPRRRARRASTTRSTPLASRSRRCFRCISGRARASRSGARSTTTPTSTATRSATATRRSPSPRAATSPDATRPRASDSAARWSSCSVATGTRLASLMASSRMATASIAAAAFRARSAAGCSATGGRSPRIPSSTCVSA